MQLYYSPGACSLSPHIVAREAGIDLDLVKVDIRSGKLEDGSAFSDITPKGYVPALRLDNGEILTEGTAIVQYLADLRSNTDLLPGVGALARYRVLEMLGYINSEIHKNYSPLFNSKSTPEVRAEKEQALQKRYTFVENLLREDGYLFGEGFTVADAYLFVVTNWARLVKLDLSSFPNLLAFQKRVAARPAVQQALEAEGLKSS